MYWYSNFKVYNIELECINIQTRDVIVVSNSVTSKAGTTSELNQMWDNMNGFFRMKSLVGLLGPAEKRNCLKG